MGRGGARPGAGRKKGSVNRLDQEARERVMAEGQVSPLEYLLSIMRDQEADQARRIDAAKAAAPYVHARLTTIDVGNKDEKPFEQVIRWAQTDSEATPDPSKS